MTREEKYAQDFGPYVEPLAPGAQEALGKGGEHPFTYCMEVVVPAMEKDGKGPDDPEAFCAWWKSEHGMARAARACELRMLTLRSAVGDVRLEMFMEREHVVVPVVALREGVMQASNAPEPELVPREVLHVAPGGWNGRPVVGMHPSENGEQVSANDPRRLERESFGSIFHAKADGERLSMEAYLDPQRAIKVGSDALRVLDRARKGQPIEVSVGAIVVTEREAGVWRAADGSSKPYSAVWKEIVPDHLAMLPEGTTGACSNDMGCGAPRSAAEWDESKHPRADDGTFTESDADAAERVSAQIRVQNLITHYLLGGHEEHLSAPEREHYQRVGLGFERLFKAYGTDALAALREIEKTGETSALFDTTRPVPSVNVSKGRIAPSEQIREPERSGWQD